MSKWIIRDWAGNDMKLTTASNGVAGTGLKPEEYIALVLEVNGVEL